MSSSWPWIKNRQSRRRGLCQTAFIMRRDWCEKSLNQSTQKGWIIRTGADETETSQALLVIKFVQVHRSIIGFIILSWSLKSSPAWELDRTDTIWSHLVWRMRGTFHQITPFGDNGFNILAKWLFNDIEWGVITELWGRSVFYNDTKRQNILHWRETTYGSKIQTTNCFFQQLISHFSFVPRASLIFTDRWSCILQVKHNCKILQLI